MKVLTTKPFLIGLGALAAIALIVFALVLALSGGDDDDSAAAVEPSIGTVSANSLKIGDCVTDANANQGDVTTFEAVSCDRPHDGEIFTLIELEGGEKARYPGVEFVNGKGQRGCRARLRRQATAEAFRDPQLGYKYVYPTQASWADGDREITCLATFKQPRTGKLPQRPQSDDDT
ncbi:MAG: septum formation family protein [Solirubrobacteraceae bacterium]|nr:septum formation family protein [Solirubrobacteraceae bacterium]